MPAWGEALDEKQIRSLVIFLREKKAERRTEAVRRNLVADDGVFAAGGLSPAGPARTEEERP